MESGVMGFWKGPVAAPAQEGVTGQERVQHHCRMFQLLESSSYPELQSPWSAVRDTNHSVAATVRPEQLYLPGEERKEP